MGNDLHVTDNNSANPLLMDWNTPFQTPPFDQIKVENYIPAFESLIEQSKNRIDAIVDNSDLPTFENTIEALEFSGEEIEKVANLFFNLNSAETSSEFQEAARIIAPMLSDFSNDISLNPRLFDRVKFVYENVDGNLLTEEKRMLLDKTFKGFVRSGANLDEKGKERFREISRLLSEYTLKFEENLLAETNGFVLHLESADDLAGLPESVVEMSKAIAKSKSLSGWAFDLTMPSYIAFMKYSEKRELREKLYRAYNTRGFKQNEFNNEKILVDIANLRLEMAVLLGYPTYADYVLEERMAQSPDKVKELLNHLLEASHSAGIKEVAEVNAFAAELGASFQIERWDWSYYSELLKDKMYSINDEAVRPYFPLDKVREGVFDLAKKLYGISFKRNTAVPVYHSDVEAYEVYDETNELLAVLYMDYFPRSTKNGGAWMTNYRSQYIYEGENIRPVVSLVFNFTKPTDTRPSLLSFSEVETFLHEFGHGLHGIFANTVYPSLSGTSVYRDFVELPSQIMENWALEKEFLDMFAGHYQTGEKIPQEMIDKLKESANFQSGYACLRQLSFGLLDMEWHSQKEKYLGDILTFERRAINKTEILPIVNNVAISSAFSHVFAGGYAAGYYGYKWAEVLDADAFFVFKSKGIFNRKTAQLFRKYILSRGGTVQPMKLYTKFRGQEPTIDALLERSGLRR